MLAPRSTKLLPGEADSARAMVPTIFRRVASFLPFAHRPFRSSPPEIRPSVSGGCTNTCVVEKAKFPDVKPLKLATSGGWPARAAKAAGAWQARVPDRIARCSRHEGGTTAARCAAARRSALCWLV